MRKHQSRRHLIIKGARYTWPQGVPPSAIFTEERRDEHSMWGKFDFPHGSARVAWAIQEDFWSTRGQVLTEQYFDALGRPHGLELSRHKDGSTQWQVAWVRGWMHGLARQFDEAGRELYRTRFIHGSGVDLWLNGREVTELREMERNVPHGVERWGHPQLPYEECHFVRGRRTGIFRRWTGLRLDPGYPKFLIDDREVSRATYLRARKRNPETP